MIFKSRRIKKLESRMKTVEESLLILMKDKLEKSLGELTSKIEETFNKTSLKTKKK